MEDLKTTKDFLDKAKELVAGDRAKEYGDKYLNHMNIANFWTIYLQRRISPHDVAVMMSLLKVARTMLGNRTDDTYVDASAYMAIAGECEKKERETTQQQKD
jgi:hypothetical protein